MPQNNVVSNVLMKLFSKSIFTQEKNRLMQLDRIEGGEDEDIIFFLIETVYWVQGSTGDKLASCEVFIFSFNLVLQYH